VNPGIFIHKRWIVRYKEVNSVALGLAAKKEIVAEINDVASRALSIAVAEYRGMEVAELTDLRIKAREQGVYLRVVRNTLAKRALADSKFADLDSALTGPLIYGFSIEAPGGAARLFKDYSKANDKLKVTALSIGSGLLGPEKLDAVASLLTRDEALAKLLATFKAPVGKFVRTINEVPSKFVRVLAAIKDEK
jgi:large subunit ribosomal protein L10